MHASMTKPGIDWAPSSNIVFTVRAIDMHFRPGLSLSRHKDKYRKPRLPRSQDQTVGHSESQLKAVLQFSICQVYCCS